MPALSPSGETPLSGGRRDIVIRKSQEEHQFQGCCCGRRRAREGSRATLNLGQRSHMMEVTEGYGSLVTDTQLLSVFWSLAVSETILNLDISVRERTRELLCASAAISIHLPPLKYAHGMARDKRRLPRVRRLRRIARDRRPVWG
jgi:hypothetical protein